MKQSQGNVNVLLYGLGPIGVQILQNCLRSENIRLIGAVDIDPNKIGQDVGVLAGKKPVNMKVVKSVDEIGEAAGLQRKLALHATGSNLQRVWPQIRQLLDRGYSVISTCEQLSYPWHAYSELSRQIDQYARERRQFVLATGINPGFVMDSLPLFATSVTQSLKGIFASRKVDVSKRRIPLQKKVGVGMTREEFCELVREGKIGHVGLEESLRLIAYGLNLSLSNVQNHVEPILATEDVMLPTGPLKKDRVGGLHQISRGTTNEGIRIELDLVIAVGVKQEDRIRIESKEMDDLEMVIPNGIFGDTGTANIIVNTAKTVFESDASGLLTMADIPLVRNIK